ncbi:transposase [Nonomuraea phyllanthi]|uniref:Transposase n=1 Tax=Nonomuraea phyllanthi TaxID=2219224 RepID=A0A5C4URX7_9ACTN|nr:transposase [Nonomuraea phyllanthi]
MGAVAYNGGRPSGWWRGLDNHRCYRKVTLCRRRFALRHHFARYRPNAASAGISLYTGTKRWVVERTLSWISQRRRCIRDYERLSEHHEAMVLWAMIIPMGRRLARTTSPKST